MGWSSNKFWKCTADALADEARCTEDWEIAYRNGNSFVYRNKVDGRPAHTYFIVKKEHGEIWVKAIGDFRSVAAAKAYRRIAKEYMASNPADIDSWVESKCKEADELIAEDAQKAKCNELTVGSKVYIKDQYIHNGWCKIVALPNAKRHSYLVDYPGLAGFLRVQKSQIDLEKTFA